MTISDLDDDVMTPLRVTFGFWLAEDNLEGVSCLVSKLGDCSCLSASSSFTSCFQGTHKPDGMTLVSVYPELFTLRS
jgi:hypothetical protein